MLSQLSEVRSDPILVQLNQIRNLVREAVTSFWEEAIVVMLWI